MKLRNKHLGKRTLLIAIAGALAACSGSPGSDEVEVASAGFRPSTAIKVEIEASDDGYRLLRGGAPYFIKGAGLDFGDLRSFAAHGGNSIRTWTTTNEVVSTQQLLDKAHANGVTVALCLEMGAEHRGFDYDDRDAVAAQLEEFRSEVLKYRDHPALLVWIIGNELNFDYTNSNVYDAVNDVSKMIHEIDPNHPTTTTITGVANREREFRDIATRAADLDFVSFQVYGELEILPRVIEEIEYDKPFFVTEWGAVGHWEVDKTTWGAPIEQTSSEKAATYMRGYTEKLARLENRLIGSYVFLWGQKQERTPTWYGLFAETGEETEAVDVMHHIWSGEWPDNRSPRLESMSLDGKAAAQSVTLRSGESYTATVDVSDYENDPLVYRWELKEESRATQKGGDFEESIPNLAGLIENPTAPSTTIRAPAAGAYRLFAYAYDDHGHAAHANIPFLVSDSGAE